MPLKDRKEFKEYQRQWRLKNPEKARAARQRRRARHAEQYAEYNRRWRAKNPGYQREYLAKWKEKNPDYQRKRLLREEYGLTLEQYEKMLDDQGRRCAICRTDKPGGSAGKAFAVDHDHGTGAVRALLCASCNQGLGFFRDDPALLAGAREYLLAHSRKRAS